MERDEHTDGTDGICTDFQCFIIISCVISPIWCRLTFPSQDIPKLFLVFKLTNRFPFKTSAESRYTWFQLVRRLRYTTTDLLSNHCSIPLTHHATKRRTHLPWRYWPWDRRNEHVGKSLTMFLKCNVLVLTVVSRCVGVSLFLHFVHTFV